MPVRLPQTESTKQKQLHYLYLGFTNATAFSPTDVMPLALWATLATATQAAYSLMMLGLVIAQTINILRSYLLAAIVLRRTSARRFCRAN